MNQLAIVIPYYKIDFFEETLKSVAAQSDKNFTLYIGNDASPDDPLPLIDKCFKKEEYQYFEYQDNLGSKNLVLQWERILVNVKEDWFQILGDDDLISENFVEEFYQSISKINENSSNVIKFSQCWIDEMGKEIRKFTDYSKLMTAFENWEKKYISGHQSSLSEHIFRRVAYEKYGFQHFPLAWGTDDIAVLEMSDHQPVYFVNEAKVQVRISKENISGKIDNTKEKEIAIHLVEEYLLQNYYQKLPKNFLRQKIEQQIKYAFQNKPSNLKINLFKMYWYLRDFKKILTLPKTYFHLYTQ